MSLDTWRKEFYPVTAAKVPKNLAVQHSLTKWIGLRKSNLKKHDVVLIINKYDVSIRYGRDSISITCESCALCQIYLVVGAKDECYLCPLENCVNEYVTFRNEQDPESMIKLLEGKL